MSIEDRISKARKEISAKKKDQHILKAEWKTLTTPERIQRLTIKYLSMKQIEPNQLKEYDALIFHNNKNKKGTKRLSYLISQFLSNSNGDE